jgi:hypothetical protein
VNLLHAYRRGARLALARWPLVTALWLFGLGFGLVFALASAGWLSEALEGSLATKTLLRRLDVEVLIDLWMHHREGLHVLLSLGAVLAAAHTALWWWLDGVIIAAVAPSPGSPWRRGTALVPAMAALFAIAIAVWLLWSAALAGVVWWLLRLTRESPSPHVWEHIVIPAAALWLLGTAWLIAVHDHARLRAGLTGADPLTAYQWALAFVAAGGENAFALALLLQLSGLALWTVYQIIGFSVPLTELIGLNASLLWGQLFLWLRTGVRLWSMAAQRQLHS